MLNTPTIRNVVNGINHRELGEEKIRDFPNSTPKDKRVDHGAMLCLINGYIESALSDTENCPVTIDNPSLSREYTERVLDENRLIPPYKIIPAWPYAPISIRLAFMHALVFTEPGGYSAPFTLDLSDDIAIAAFMSSLGPKRYIHDRVRRYLKQLDPACLFWMAFEMTEKGLVHLHGSFWVPDIVPEGDLRLALRKAGGLMRGKAAGSQLNFTDHRPGRGGCWGTYARKSPKKMDALFGGAAYSASDKLRVAAQELYESARFHLNAQRRILAA